MAEFVKRNNVAYDPSIHYETTQSNKISSLLCQKLDSAIHFDQANEHIDRGIIIILPIWIGFLHCTQIPKSVINRRQG